MDKRIVIDDEDFRFPWLVHGTKDTAVFTRKALRDVAVPGFRNGLLQRRPAHDFMPTYNAGMKKSARIFTLLALAVAAFSAAAQGEPPPPPPGGQGYGYPGQMQRPFRDWRDASPEQREQWRAERRQHRREQWRDMSPEDRQQLRSDIRDAGRMYRRGRGRD